MACIVVRVALKDDKCLGIVSELRYVDTLASCGLLGRKQMVSVIHLLLPGEEGAKGALLSSEHRLALYRDWKVWSDASDSKIKYEEPSPFVLWWLGPSSEKRMDHLWMQVVSSEGRTTLSQSWRCLTTLVDTVLWQGLTRHVYCFHEFSC